MYENDVESVQKKIKLKASKCKFDTSNVIAISQSIIQTNSNYEIDTNKQDYF
jgi:hypothetical protein